MGRKPKFEGKTKIVNVPVTVGTHRALSYLACGFDRMSIPDVVRSSVDNFTDPKQTVEEKISRIKSKFHGPFTEDPRILQVKFPMDTIRQLTWIASSPEFGDIVPTVTDITRIVVEDYVQVRNIDPAKLALTEADFRR